MQRDVEKVEEIYEAFRKRKTQAILELMAPEVGIHQSSELPWGGDYSGRDGLKEFLARFTSHLEAQVEIEHLIDAGDHVAVVGRLVGKAHATGLEFDVPVVHLWQFSEGRIVRLMAYTDNATLLAALAG